MTIYDISDLHGPESELPDGEVTIRCRVQTTAIEGDTEGLDALYLVEDPHNNLQERAALSFWSDSGSVTGIPPTDPIVLATVGLTPDGDPDDVSMSDLSGTKLSRGEELVVRAVPNYGDYEGEERLYLNVTGFVIRDPSTEIGKGYLRSADNCPRRSYLEYTKQVYMDDNYNIEPPRDRGALRGDVVHAALEKALEGYRDRFEADEWTEDSTGEFCQSLLEEEYAIRQAMLNVAGVGNVDDDVEDIVYRLFTDDRFTDVLLEANSVAAERELDRRFGYDGRVDVVVDGTPYDLKTRRNPNDADVEGDAYQLKLYLFVLLLERLDDDESLSEALTEDPAGYLVYPNVDAETVRFEEVRLTRADVAELLSERNRIVTTGSAFAPPSTYNRDCDGCRHKNREWITGPDDSLPPACTYHCQNERRWPCYETTGGAIDTDCSLFGSCEQRTEFRDPDRVDHFERLRAGLQAERETRDVAASVFDRLDPDLLAEAGRRVPDLELAGASGGGVLRYESENPVVPVFQSGDIVRVREQGEAGGKRAVFHGIDEGIYEFKFLETGSPPQAVMRPDTRYEAVPTSETSLVDDQYLPYLDFAQRRGYPATHPRTTDATVDTDGVVALDDMRGVAEHLDREQVFVDLPVRERRLDDVAELVRSIVDADLPQPDGDTHVASEDTRTLVLGTNPELVDAAYEGQPDGEHYRIDGTTHGDDSIEALDGRHSVQQRLLSANSLVSSVSYATSDWPTQGSTELFHSLTDGDFVDDDDRYPDREHTDQFFDVLVLLGSELITEPEYRFLQDVADRVVAVGDRRRRGVEMLSEDATKADLDVSQLETAHDHFGSFPSERGVSLQVTGHAPPALQEYYDGHDDDFSDVDGSIRFLDVEGTEETDLETVTLRTTVRSANDTGRRLVFDVTDTTADPMVAYETFSDLESLDHTQLPNQSVVVVEGHNLYLRAIEDLPDEDADRHEIVVEADVAEVAQFGEALLANRPAERIVANVVDEDVDLVVTPFERHATRIKRLLEKPDHESVPVKSPRDVDGEIADHAVVSFGIANELGIVRPPVMDPSVLYGLLSCARNLTLVGDGCTLESKDVFRDLLDAADPYHGTDR